MLAVLTAVVAVLLPLTVLNLILLFAVIRRLKTAEARTGQPPVELPAVGTPIGAAAAPHVAGKKFAACVLVNCKPCEAQIEQLRTDSRFSPEDIVFFVFGPGDGVADLPLVESLDGLGTIVRTTNGGDIGQALGNVTSFPTLLRTDGEHILAAERTWSALATSGAVPAL